MSTFTTHAPLREKEIRALALQAAATWAISWGRTSSDTVLETARHFATYIEEDRIPSDDSVAAVVKPDTDGTGW